MTSYDTAAAIIGLSCDPFMTKQLTLHEAFGSEQPTSEAGSSSSQQLAPQEASRQPAEGDSSPKRTQVSSKFFKGKVFCRIS